MRVACLYLPSFPLQAHVREAPHLAGRPIAIAGRRSGCTAPPRVLGCSRAAWRAGIRPNMPVADARAAAAASQTDAIVVLADDDTCRRAVVALAESLSACAATVDVGAPDTWTSTHLSVFVTAPAHMRGEKFAGQLLDVVSRNGLRARVGVADDRYTAWAAAATVRTATPDLFARAIAVVPRGGSAAFLAPLSLSLLPMADDVRTMLNTLGIRTIGDFAALPPPSVGRRWAERDADLSSLAQGEDTSVLEPFTGVLGNIVERLELPSAVDEPQSLAFVARPLAERVCQRLRGRDAAAATMTISLLAGDGRETGLSVVASPPANTESRIVELIREALAQLELEHTVGALAIEVAEEADPVAGVEPLFVAAAEAIAECAADQPQADLAGGRDATAPERVFQMGVPDSSRAGRPKRSRRRRVRARHTSLKARVAHGGDTEEP